eukprot:c29925_g1_i1 orf=91-276(+)
MPMGNRSPNEVHMSHPCASYRGLEAMKETAMRELEHLLLFLTVYVSTTAIPATLLLSRCIP